MVRLTGLLLMARKQVPAWKKANRHYRYTMSRPWTIQAQIQNLPGRDRPKVQVEPVKEWKIFKGDLVQVLKGKDTSKLGLVLDIVKQRNWVLVEGLNCHYRRIGKMPGYSGTMIKSEGALDVREVALVDPSDNKPTDIDFRYTEAGEKVRVSKRTGRIIPIPIVDSDSRDYKTKESYVEMYLDKFQDKQDQAKGLEDTIGSVIGQFRKSSILYTNNNPKTLLQTTYVKRHLNPP